MAEASGKVTISGALPEAPLNGVGIHSKDFIADPRKMRLVVGLMAADKTVVNNKTDSTYPVLAFKHLELVLPGKDTKAVAEALAHALASRTGAEELPLQYDTDMPLKL